MVKLTVRIGKTGMMTFEGDAKGAHKFSSVYGRLPDKCDACGKDNLYLFHKSPGGNDYFGIACRDCNAEQTFHQKKEGGFYITDDDRMTVYVKGSEASKQGDEPKPADPF